MKSFFKNLQVGYASKPQQPPYQAHQEHQVIDDLKGLYTTYEAHLLPKIVKTLEKATHDSVPKDVREQISKLDKQIDRLEKKPKTSDNKFKFRFKKKRSIDKNIQLESVNNEKIITLKKQKTELEKEYPQLNTLREMKTAITSNRTKQAVLKARELSKEIGKDKLGGFKAIKSSNDRNNIRRFLNVTEMHETLSEVNPSSPIEKVREQFAQFRRQFFSYGLSSIIGGDKISVRTEKGKVYLQTKDILNRAEAIFESKLAPEKKPVVPTKAFTEDEKQLEQAYRTTLDSVASKFKNQLVSLTSAGKDAKSEKATLYKMVIAALEEKPFNVQKFSEHYVKIEQYISKHNKLIVRAEGADVLARIKRFTSQGAIDEIKKGLETSIDSRPPPSPLGGRRSS